MATTKKLEVGDTWDITAPGTLTHPDGTVTTVGAGQQVTLTQDGTYVHTYAKGTRTVTVEKA